MGTGWRRAFCTTIPRNNPSSDSPSKSGKLGFFKSSSAGGSVSNPSTPRSHSNNEEDAPRLRLRPKSHKLNSSTSVIDNLNITPRLRCKTNTTVNNLNHPPPSSPRSPFSIFKRSNCGVCLQTLKSGHNKSAIFTAECSHTFHFPCISQHVKQQNLLACPVCKSTWRDASFLQFHKLDTNITPQPQPQPQTPNSTHNNKKNIIIIKSKPYDDDEPLRTPRAPPPPGILPIPEEEENVDDDNDDDDDDQEFQGFFTNPVSSSSCAAGGDYRNVDLMLVPQVAVISSTHSQSHDTYALVLKLKAPPPPSSTRRRAPTDLVAVLDVTPTMAGPKLQMLKRAMRLVISSLGPADRLAIVAFSASPKRLLPLTRMHSRGQRSARRTIDHLASSAPGSCAAPEALRKATKVLQDRRERNPVATIILLSDDHVTDSNQRHPSSTHISSTRFAHVEIPVHTLENNAFTKCVGGLLSVVAQDLRIQLDVAAGSDPAEITAVYSCNGKPTVLNAASLRFGDLYAEEEREVLVELRVPTSNTGSHHVVLSARCSYNDPATQELICAGEKALLVPRAQTVRSSSSSSSSSTLPKIQRLRNLFIATRAVAESRLLVEHSKLTTAHQLLSSARALLMQSASAEEFVKGLESELLDVEWRVQYQQHVVQQQQQHGVMMMVDENGEPLTPTSAWRTAEKLAKVAVMKKPLKGKLLTKE